MASLFTRLDNFLNKDLWELSDSPSELKSLSVSLLRLSYKIVQELLNGEITRRASSLVLITLLTLVPVLAIAFSVLKALGVHNTMEPFLQEFLAPLGEKGSEITFRIVGYVDRVNIGLLGAVGVASLLYTIMNTIQQIENAFNYLWQIKEERSFLRRFRDYMSILLTGPVLIFAAAGITTTVMSYSIAQRIISIEPFGTALFIAGKILPYLLISVAFTLLYFLLPYTKVNFRSALVGGVSAGILWEAGSWMFARFMMTSARYPAIYSGFAVVLLFMLWLYYNWVIILTGVKISFYHQFPTLLAMRDDRLLYDERQMRRLAIVLMHLVGYNYYYGLPRWTMASLVGHLRIPKIVVQDILNALEEKGLILRTGTENALVPARDIDTITLDEVVRTVEDEFGNKYSLPKYPAPLPGIEKIMNETDDAVRRVLSGETIKGLVIKSERPG